MNKYHNGKIYKIVDIGYNKQYIGSTTESLSQRMTRHRSEYKRHNEGKKVCNASSFLLFDEFGVENCKIELIEYCKSDTREELLKREGEHIKITDCVNKVIAGRTSQEYRQENKEIINGRSRDYRNNNKDKVKLRKKQHYESNKKYYKEYKRQWALENKTTINCECGSQCLKNGIRRHERTIKHQEYLKSLENQDD